MNTAYRKLLYIATLPALMLAGCGDELNIKPQNDISQDVALESPQYLEGLVVGAYDRLSDDDLYGGWIQMNADLLGTNGDIRWSGTYFNPEEIYQKAVTAINAQAEETWTAAYEAINVCNEVLANLDREEDEDQRAKFEGEAKFIRGALYFELVRQYAKDWEDGDPAANLGLPLKLTPTDLTYNPEANFIPRNNVLDVYNQVVKDLTEATTLLPIENFGAGSKNIFATSWAAKAMLARVRLQRREYDAARVLANDVIENGPFQLVDRIDRAFNQAENSSEDIFAIQVTNQDGTNSLQTFYAGRGFNGRRDIRIQGEHLALYDSTDTRLTLLIYQESGNSLSGKYRDQFANIPVIRLAEMYLIRAEGNLLAGGTQAGPNTPGADLQVLRTRANAMPAPAVPTIDNVMLERKLELCFEGHFLHDIKRRQATITQLGTYPWNDNVLVLPIPQREIDANPALQEQQNPGY